MIFAVVTLVAALQTPDAAATSESNAVAPAIAAASSTYPYRFVPYPPKDANAPRIYAVYLNGKTLHAPGPIDIRVEAAPDVVSVEEHTGKRGGPLTKSAPGIFTSVGKLPQIPVIAKGVEVMLNFVAKNAAGKTTTVTVPVELR